MTQIIRRTQFIKDGENIFLPRPSGWLAGWARHVWFEEHMGVKPHIASPDVWERLTHRLTVRELVEHEDGALEVKLKVSMGTLHEITATLEESDPSL